GCRFALGTDMNPGSSMTESLPLQMWLATTHFGLSVDEAWLGVTRVAAVAARRAQARRLARRAPGGRGLWHRDHPRRGAPPYGENHVARVMVGGVTCTPAA